MAKKNNINSDTDTKKLAKEDLCSKLAEAGKQLESTELLLDAKDVFEGLKEKYIRATKDKSEGMQTVSDEEVDRVAKKILSKCRKAFEELSK
ncbi:conserved protein of unknown function [Tepidanaerobacter acetatoxydans Re1]|uniref:Uncharacterized protein n=1 Tax=Tepidanaerobacter acetatoxydans (strain DSM 21804 / JCM 16047 / Re1) TaxID=1209989 RepID=F4LT88_TEPAE|nr:hypothetical protein [Tepidanaerobacter acetatoxydans]AEE92488.1 hypothetical protein TepRe1_2381 [Tepidanaerobacter acetatoxydans Re1]CCP27427.1 conserved protein of unknown function [Tepidanaerobacter acetatoxydans Re1]